MRGQDTTMLAVFMHSGIEYTPDYAAAATQIAEKVQTYPPTWYFIYMILLIGLFAWARLYYGNILLQTIQASTNFQVSNKIFRNNSLVKNQLDLVLYLFYFLSMAFLLHYMELRIGMLPYGLQGARLFLFNFALLLALFSARYLVHSTVGALFNRAKIVREYLYNMFIYNKLAGLVALPLMFLLVYTAGALQEIIFWISVNPSCIIIQMVGRYPLS